MSEFPEVDQNELFSDLMGFRMVRWMMNPEAINALASVVPERGEQLWQRFKAWAKQKQRESEDEEADFSFFDWVKAIFAEHQIDVAVKPPDVLVKGSDPATEHFNAFSPAPPARKLQVGELIKSSFIGAMRMASDREDMKRRIKAVIRREIRGRPQNSVSPNWSTNPDARSATVWIEGYESLSVNTRRPEPTVVPQDVRDRCIVVLHGAVDEADAKRQIEAELRHSLRPAPQMVQFMFNWSNDRRGRSASVDPHQFAPFFITTAPRSSASPDTPTELEQLAGDNLALQQSLPSVNEALLRRFYSKVPERGDALWTRFTTWRDAQPDAGGSDPINKWVGSLIVSELLA